MERLEKEKKTNFLKVFFKGLLMGMCDLIPGISGGTIAFITGIYERLILAITNITPRNILELLKNLSVYQKEKSIKSLEKFDLLFLLVLFLGIFTAIFIGAKLISTLIENYFSLTISFFIGLILASSLIILKEIKTHSNSNKFLGLLGFLFGISLLLLSPLKIQSPSFIYILISGFFAIFALFLPGISGSFILLILGVYEFIINSVKNIQSDFSNLIPFGIGAILSVFLVSRLIKFLFEKDKCKTLYFLFGLVLGTILIPIFRVYKSLEVINLKFGFEIFVLFILGFLIVFLLQKFKDN